MASYIEITFNSQPAEDTQLIIVDSITGISMVEVFKTTRSGIGESEIGVDLDHCVFQYKINFNGDYNNTFLYSVVEDLVNNKVTITGVNASSQFSVTSNTTAGAITTNIVNDTPPVVFTVDSIAISEASSNPCSTFDIDITTNVQADDITQPVSESVSSNPHSTTFNRANEINIQMSKDSVVGTKKIRVPLLLSAYFNVTVANTPTGATVTAEKLYPLTSSGSVYELVLTLEYSIDNSVWQSSNSWSGLAIGSYTLYIRDNIGCSISIPFEVTAFTPNVVEYDGIFEISNVNPIRFKLNETISNCGTRRNNLNSLSHEEDVLLNKRDYLQPFQKCDTISLQLKSNYETTTLDIVDCDGTETNVPLTQSTENMDITDVRDGTVLQSDSNTIGVRFGAGNTYDSTTLIQNGSYNLVKLLMDWINVGDYILVEGAGWCLVTEITDPSFNDIGYYVAWTATAHNGLFTLDQVVKITTIYNAVNYERFEASLDLSTYDGDYYLKVAVTDTKFGTLEYISEWIRVSEEIEENHHLIDYYNSENNEINYGTGITFRVRFPFVKALKWKPNTEQDIYVTDTKTILLENTIREMYEIELSPLPTSMAQKAVLILSHDRLNIDGINYVMEGEPEIVSLGVTNLYIVKATIVRSDYVFNNESGTTANEILIGSGIPLAIDENAEGLLWIE